MRFSILFLTCGLLFMHMGCANLPVQAVADNTPVPSATPLVVLAPTQLPTATNTIEPTALVATATPLPTATNTLPPPTNTPPLPTETPLPTVLPTGLPTNTSVPPTAPPPSPTAVPTVVPTATNIPAPTPTAAPASSSTLPVISDASARLAELGFPAGDYVRIVGLVEAPYDEIYLEWSFSSATVERIDTLIPLRNGGSYPVVENPANSGRKKVKQVSDLNVYQSPQAYTVHMRTSAESPLVFATVSLGLPCYDAWYPPLLSIESIDPNLGSPCPVVSQTSRGFVQWFENGLAIWVEARNEIVFYVKDKTSYTSCTTYPDTFTAGVDAVNDPTLTPPDGLYQPEYGVGKVWRENWQLREEIGWAVDWGTNYELLYQAGDGYRYGAATIWTLADGRILWDERSQTSYCSILTPQ